MMKFQLNRFLMSVLAIALVVNLGVGAEAKLSPLVGTWEGELAIPDGSDFTIGFIVTQQEDGLLAATLVMNNGQFKEPVKAVTFSDGVVQWLLKNADARVEGKMSADGKTIEATVSQGDFNLPVTLTRVDQTATPTQEKPVEETDQKNDITYSTEIATPHVDWASKLPGGPIAGFFIPSIEFGRDMVELMQRIDLDPTTVSIDRAWDVNCWGIGDFYDHRYRGDRDDFTIVYGFVEKDLTSQKHFDVIVIPGLNGWTRLTKPARDAILQRVQEGAGLVLIHPFLGDVENHPFEGDEKVGDVRLWEISPLVDCPNDFIGEGGYPQVNKEAITRGQWEVAQSHYITNGLPLDLMPEGIVGGSFYKYGASGDVLIKSGDYPILAVKQYGKGRVVSLAYVEQGFMPEAVDPVASRIYWDYWEYQYALLTRCILWAAGRENGIALQNMVATPEQLTITLTSAQSHAVDLHLTGNGEGGEPIVIHHVNKQLTAGENTIVLPMSELRPAAGWPGGLVIFNIVMRDENGANLSWGAASLVVPKQATLEAISSGAESYVRGQTLTAVVQAKGDLAGLQIRLKIKDDMDRLLSAESKPAATEVKFAYPLQDFFGYNAYLTAELVNAHNVVVDRLQMKPVFVAMDKRRQPEFTAQIGFASGRPYWSALRRRLIYAGGVRTGLTWTEGVNNGLDIPHGSFGVYWYDRGPTNEAEMNQAIAEYEKTGNFAALQYNTKVELFNRTKDKKFLVRTPCFDDPAVLKGLYDGVYASAKSKAKYNIDYYFVGDEGSLTSYGDEFDFCWSAHTLQNFRAWLKTQYSTLNALNAKWKTSFAKWDDVVPYTTEEAIAKSSFAPWADHRTYMEISFANAYQTVRNAVVAGDPEGHIAVSGTQGTNSYNGCDWYRLDQVIDDFLSYGGGNQWDLHRSFAKPGAMIGFWTGYGSSGLSVQNAIWNAAIHNVLYPQIFWIYSYLDPDFTYSKSAEDMGEAFKALRFEGVGRLFREATRLHDGIALHFSMPSLHAGSIYLERPKKEGDQVRSLGRSRDGWVRTINDLGWQFNFVSYEQVEKGALASGQYKVFIMPFSAALSPEEAENIRRFAENGGVVIADAAAGLMDNHCAFAPEGMLHDFLGVSTAPAEQRSFTRLSGDIAVTKEGEAWGLKPDDVANFTAVETMKAGAGTPLLTIGDNDAVVVHRVGKGWAVYLNVGIESAGRRRRNQPEGPAPANPRPLVDLLLTHLGVSRDIEVLDVDGKTLTQAILARYQFGESEALAIVKENVGIRAVEGQDGVTVYHDEKLGDVAKQELVIRLPQKYYVTNVRTGERLGYTNEVHTEITVGGALVLGLAKADTTVSIKGPATAKLGAHPHFALQSSRKAKALVRCHFFGPDGSFLPEYAQNVILESGSGSVTLPSALSDTAGMYTLKVTDVITGATAEAKLALQ